MGIYGFGFKLENSLDKVHDTQIEVEKTKGEMEKAKAALKEAESSVVALQEEVTTLLARARTSIVKLEGYEASGHKVVDSLISLSENDQKDAATVKLSQSNKARQGFAKLWQKGFKIRIGFLDGSEEWRTLTKKHATEWARYANIYFDFIDQPESADVRITFKGPGEMWSFLGTDCLIVPKTEPTMNLSFFQEGHDDRYIRSMVLHAFGHLLGLVSEHSNPNAKIPWDMSYMATFLGSKKAAERFVEKANANTMITRPFDRDSVMLFPVTPEQTKGRFQSSLNSELSTSDKEFIARLYPK